VPLAITRHTLSHTGSVPLDPDRNQLVRSHPERLANGYDDSIAVLKGRASMSGVSLRPRQSELPIGSHTQWLSTGQMAKVVGFNAGSPYAATTGTSAENVLCATDGMSVCTALVLAGNPQGDEAGPAKVRVFHAFPLNS